MTETFQDAEFTVPKSTSPFADEPPKPVRVRDEKGRLRASAAMQPGQDPIQEPEPVVEVEAEEVLNDTLEDGSKRIPFGQKHSKLHYSQRSGYMRRWVNDTPGRIMGAEKGGYKHVKDNEGNPVKTHAGLQALGGAMNCYLMEIPMQWYQEDFAFKQESVDETDKAIYGGTFKEEPDDKRYLPKDTPIKFGLSRGFGKG